MSLLAEFGDSFAKSDENLGSANFLKRGIKVQGHKPIKQAPYSVPFNQFKIITDNIEDMKGKGIIKNSKSPCSSHIILDGKKN